MKQIIKWNIVHENRFRWNMVYSVVYLKCMFVLLIILCLRCLLLLSNRFNFLDVIIKVSLKYVAKIDWI